MKNKKLKSAKSVFKVLTGVMALAFVVALMQHFSFETAAGASLLSAPVLFLDRNRLNGAPMGASAAPALTPSVPIAHTGTSITPNGTLNNFTPVTAGNKLENLTLLSFNLANATYVGGVIPFIPQFVGDTTLPTGCTFKSSGTTYASFAAYVSSLTQSPVLIGDIIMIVGDAAIFTGASFQVTNTSISGYPTGPFLTPFSQTIVTQPNMYLNTERTLPNSGFASGVSRFKFTVSLGTPAADSSIQFSMRITGAADTRLYSYTPAG